MFKNCSHDFKNKIEKRFDILLARKRCSYCFLALSPEHLNAPIGKIIKNISFNNKNNIYLFPFKEENIPINKKFKNYYKFYTIQLKQNKPKNKEYFKILKFLIVCKNCFSTNCIEAPKHFFG